MKRPFLFLFISLILTSSAWAQNNIASDLSKIYKLYSSSNISYSAISSIVNAFDTTRVYKTDTFVMTVLNDQYYVRQNQTEQISSPTFTVIVQSDQRAIYVQNTMPGQLEQLRQSFKQGGDTLEKYSKEIRILESTSERRTYEFRYPSSVKEYEYIQISFHPNTHHLYYIKLKSRNELNNHEYANAPKAFTPALLITYTRTSSPVSADEKKLLSTDKFVVFHQNTFSLKPAYKKYSFINRFFN